MNSIRPRKGNEDGQPPKKGEASTDDEAAGNRQSSDPPGWLETARTERATSNLRGPACWGRTLQGWREKITVGLHGRESEGIIVAIKRVMTVERGIPADDMPS